MVQTISCLVGRWLRQKSIKANKVIAICQRKQKQGKKRKEQIMVEQPKYLEMTLSQLKAYVESSESNVLLVVEFPKGDQKDGE